MMCGRFDFHGDAAQIAQLCAIVGEVPSGVGRYNLAPSLKAMAAYEEVSTGTRQLVPMKFGIPPGYNRPGQVINARSETVHSKPLFRTAFTSQRCLVFANGFYEWARDGKKKQPYYFTLLQHPVFAFAAIYTEAKEQGPCFAILTTQANQVVEPLHDRMPVILPLDALDLWMTHKTPSSVLHNLLVPYAADAMQVCAVSRAMNNPRFEGPQCILPADMASA